MTEAMRCHRCEEVVSGRFWLLADDSPICEECVEDAAFAGKHKDFDIQQMRHELFHVLRSDDGCFYCTHGIAA